MTELTVLLRVALAIALCAVVGLEREFHGRPAGLRTHLLVGGGAALIMGIGLAFVERMTVDSGLTLDVARLAAGVVTGIGFLGAGTIIRQGDWVHGLTTAASVWFVAGVGIACGLGLYVTASGAAGAGFIVLFGISRVEAHMPNLVRRRIILQVPLDTGLDLSDEIARFFADRHIRTRLLRWQADRETNSARIVLQLIYWRDVDLLSLGKDIRALTEATTVEIERP